MIFGYQGNSNDPWASEKFYASRFICPDAGILNSVSVHLLNETGSDHNVQVGVYCDNAGTVGTKLVNSATVSIPAAFDDWKIFNLSAALVQGSAYWLAVQVETYEDNFTVYETGGDDNQSAYAEVWTFGDWSDDPDGLSYTNCKIEIYATYTLATITPYTWGMMAKNQIDPEKIEEAITRLIAKHEADPEAHLGAGESLQSHRASEIIDHVAESIVEDKISEDAVTPQKIILLAGLLAELSNMADFEDFSSYVTGTGSTTKMLRQSIINTGPTANSIASVYRQMNLGVAFSPNMRFAWRIYWNESFANGSELYLKLGGGNYLPDTGNTDRKCIGFKITPNYSAGELASYHVVGFVRREASLYEYNLGNVERITEESILEFQSYDDVTYYVVQFYIDGVFKATSANIDLSPLGNEFLVHAVKNPSGGYAVGNLFVISFKLGH